MEIFLTFLDQYRGGILVLSALIIFLVLIIQWLAWIFHLGRYKKQEGLTGPTGSSRDNTAQFVFGEFLAKVISDFRNLLAVLIVLVFALVLAIAIFRSGTPDELAASLQAVMATLGGLVGSIVGYYFGESAVKSNAGTTISNPQAPMQQTPGGKKEEKVSEAPSPPPSSGGKPINDV